MPIYKSTKGIKSVLFHNNKNTHGSREILFFRAIIEGLHKEIIKGPTNDEIKEIENHFNTFSPSSYYSLECNYNDFYNKFCVNVTVTNGYDEILREVDTVIKEESKKFPLFNIVLYHISR